MPPAFWLNVSKKSPAILQKEGYHVVIIGDKNHPEVKAVVGSADNVEVVADESDLDKISNHKKLGVICQTTQSPDYFADMIGRIGRLDFQKSRLSIHFVGKPCTARRPPSSSAARWISCLSSAACTAPTPANWRSYVKNIIPKLIICKTGRNLI